MNMEQTTAEQLVQDLGEALKASASFDPVKHADITKLEYAFSKYAREDNTPENAKYLGYLDAQELYPDFTPISFKSYLTEVFAGQGVRPYEGRF
jgi:hypothetical protein